MGPKLDPNKCTGVGRTKIHPEIFQGTLAILGPRGLKVPGGAQDNSDSPRGPGPIFTRPLGALGALGQGTLAILAPGGPSQGPLGALFQGCLSSAAILWECPHCMPRVRRTSFWANKKEA